MAEVTGKVSAWQGSVTGLNLNVPEVSNAFPIGPAGGSLGGTYPNPTVVTNANLTGPVTSVGNATTITATGVVAATYGNATNVAQVAINAAGQVTTASNVLISGVAPGGAAGGSLGGTYPNPTVVTNANLTGVVTSVGNATSFAALTGVATPNNANAATAGVPLNGFYCSTLDPAIVYQRTV